ncbi:hypothetical protein ACN6MY_06705 [Peribacillus sp. B-H-3]|uniref:hypothetical protein n=1 Tax=Peribacillus sp. B-H-3 TaxID=3400420 RepID=UPI003B025D14
MKKYAKLVNFEVNRFGKMYLALLLITVLSQFIGVIVHSNSYMSNAHQDMQQQSLTEAQYLSNFGPTSFLDIMNSFWFLGPIALSAIGLILYIFLIWYRDWFGKNTFIYRLLMLPTSRLNVYLAKATAIFLMVLGLTALQLLILPLENELFLQLVPEHFRSVFQISTLIEGNQVLNVIIPRNFPQFILSYGIGFMCVFALFTAIMFERSYRIKGVFFGILYFAASLAVFLSPLLLIGFTDSVYLYPMELAGLELILGLFVIGASIAIGKFLINRKVTV